jgi:IclR family pca regulon transcriptional regulator
MKKKPGKDKKSYYVNSFARGLSVIQAFGTNAPKLTISQVSERARLDRAVVRRLLLTLCDLGFAFTDGKHFELTARILRLGHSYLEATGFIDSELQLILNKLSGDLQEAVSLTVLEGTNVLFIKRCDAINRRVRLSIDGGTLPILVSASGRLFLSLMKDIDIIRIFKKTRPKKYTRYTVTELDIFMETIRIIRKAGYSLVDQELEEGFLSLSVPVENHSGKVIAALNASSISSRMTKQRMIKEFLPMLNAAAIDITNSLP